MCAGGHRRATRREGGVAAADNRGGGGRSAVGAPLRLRRSAAAHVGGDAALAEDVHGGRCFARGGHAVPTWRRALRVGPLSPPVRAMSLSRLEKDAVAAEEARVAALRARAARALKDEEQVKRKEAEESKAHLRYCFKGACKSGAMGGGKRAALRAVGVGEGRRGWVVILSSQSGGVSRGRAGVADTQRQRP